MPDAPELRHAAHGEGGGDLTVGAVLSGMVHEHRALLMDRREGSILGHDPEPLHQMRTSTRRLRSALKLCRGAVPRQQRAGVDRELTWLAQALGPARDLDVLWLELPPLLEAMGSAAHDPWRGKLADWLNEERQAARRPVGPVSTSRRFADLMEDLAQVARQERPGRKAGMRAADLLGQRLSARLQQFRLEAAAVSPSSTDAQLHRLRILGKRLRYGCELAQTVLPTEPFAPALRVPHDLLGAHQDAAVAVGVLDRFRCSGAAVPSAVHDAWKACLEVRRAQLRTEFFSLLPAIHEALGDSASPAPGTLAASLR